MSKKVKENEVLLMGGAGFIGTSLSRVLGASRVTIFDNFSPIVHNKSSIRAVTESGAELISGSVLSRHDLELLTERAVPETLVYLIAETGTGRSLYNCELNSEVNTLGLSKLLDVMSSKRWFPKRIVLTSTRAVYGEGAYNSSSKDLGLVYPTPRSKEMLERHEFDYDGLEPIDMSSSSHLAKPTNIYGATKLAQEFLISSWCNSFDIPLITFRLQNVYGAGQSLSNPYTGVLVQFMKSALNGSQIQIFENGGITRDFVHVDDVANLLELAINGLGSPGTYDCGTGNRIDLYDVGKIICEQRGLDEPSLTTQYRLGDVRHACANTTRTKIEFGWRAKVKLEDGLVSLYDFVVAEAKNS